MDYSLLRLIFDKVPFFYCNVYLRLCNSGLLFLVYEIDEIFEFDLSEFNYKNRAINQL